METVEIAADNNAASFRFPVQWVNRPNSDFRGFTGMVAAGSIAPGDAVQILPSGKDAIMRGRSFDKSLPKALPKQSVTLTLDREKWTCLVATS